MFTAYSTQGQLKPRLILAEGFWDGRMGFSKPRLTLDVKVFV